MIEAEVKRSSLAILVLIWFATQFLGVFSPPLLDDVDGIHMEAAKEMVVRNDYVTLYVDGIRYLDKPPLPYWLGAFSIRLFGPHAWSVRLVLAFSVLILTLYLYNLASCWFGERAGFYSACAFSTAVGPYLFTRFFIPDVILALWMTIAADLILRMTNDVKMRGIASSRHVIFFSLTCTAAVLTKGLIGVFFPLGLLILYLIVLGRLRVLTRLRLVLGATTFFLTAVPWHVLAAIRNAATGDSRGWFWFYFINEQINRYLNKRIPRDYDKVPLLTFWLLLIVWLMPWGIFLVAELRQRLVSRRTFRLGGPQTLCVLWATLILVFFSFSTRQEYYTLPAVPALSLLIGILLAEDEKRPTRQTRIWLLACSGALFFIGLTVGLACGYLAFATHTPAPGAELYEALAKHPEDYQLSFGHFFDFTATAFGFFRIPLIGMALSMFFMTGVSFALRLKRKIYASNLAVALCMCAVINCVHMGLKIFYPILGSESLARAIRQQWETNDKVVLDGEYSNGSSINFYLGEPVYMLNGRIDNLWYGSLYADAPHRFETTASFLNLWRSPQRIFFVTHDEKRTVDWQRQFGGIVVASSSGKFVLLNHAHQRAP